METSCCFFGHRDTPEYVKPKLKSVIEKMIEEHEVTNFYVGSQGNFDFMVLSVLKELSCQYPEIRYASVLAYLSDAEKVEEGTETIYPEGLENVPMRFCIAKRNDWMLEKSNYVICCVRHITGGAAKYYEKAKKKNRTVINIADE